jgi:hypothetical protein
MPQRKTINTNYWLQPAILKGTVKIQKQRAFHWVNILLISILDNRKKLTLTLLISVLVAFEVQRHVIFPIESLLNFEITQHASMVYLPAGVIFLSFYLLRWWFLPVVLIGRTWISVQLGGADIWFSALIFSAVVSLLYPAWLHLLNNAKWDVFGDADQSQLTVTGAMIFALLISFSTGILSAIQQTVTGVVPLDQALQYTVHFVVGDTLGTGVIIFLFYRLLKWNVSLRSRSE